MAPSVDTGVHVFFTNGAAGGPGAKKFVVISEINGGSGTPNTMVRMFTSAQARNHFGDSQGAEVITTAFSLPRLNDYEIWAFGIDASGYTVNTTTATWTDTTTEAGTRVMRLGPYSVGIPLANGDDPTAQALAANTAVNDAVIPYTSTVLAGVQTITTKHKGRSAARETITIDLRDGETGVEGSTVVLLNNDDATGEEVTLSAAQIAEIRTISGLTWWVTNGQASGYRTAVDVELENGWSNLNQYSQATGGVVTADQADFITFMGGATPTNFRHWSDIAQVDAPDYELTTGVRAIAAIESQILITGRDNPGLANLVLTGSPSPGIILDSAAIKSVGGNALLPSSDGGVVRLLITGRLKNNGGQPDLTLQSVSGVLARAHVLESMGNELVNEIGSTIVNDALTPRVGETSLKVIANLTISNIKVNIEDGYIFANPSDAADLLRSVVATTDVNIANGFAIEFDMRIVKVLQELTVNARAT